MCIPTVTRIVACAVLLVAVSTEYYSGENLPARSRVFEFSYSVSLSTISAAADKVEIFLPLPQSDNCQVIQGLTIHCKYPYEIYSEPEYGNKILYVMLNGSLPERVDVAVDFTVDRKLAVAPNYDRSTLRLQRFLMADSLVPFHRKIGAEAQRALKGDPIETDKAKAIYDHVIGTMSYDKSGTGWGRGDAMYACDVRKGNCTDFHSLLIGMNRSVGIPSRFVMGFQVPENSNEGEIPGYHCWAEFFTGDKGWIPVDASEAWKHPEKKEFFFGSLDANRVQFTIGRDILIQPNKNTTRLNYFVYPYVLIDEKPSTDYTTRFSFQDLDR